MSSLSKSTPMPCWHVKWGGSEVTIGPSSKDKPSLRTSCHRFVKKGLFKHSKRQAGLERFIHSRGLFGEGPFFTGENRKTLSYSRQWPRTAAGSLTSQHWNPTYSSFRPSTGGVFNLSQDCIKFYKQPAPFTMSWWNQEATAAAALRGPEEDREEIEKTPIKSLAAAKEICMDAPAAGVLSEPDNIFTSKE